MSERTLEDSEMSSLAEMQSLVHEAASVAPSDNWKDRIGAASRLLGFSWERTKAFYYRDARRVDAEEMDHARAEVARLRTAAKARRDAEHVAWLREQIERYRATDPDHHQPHILALESVLGMACDPAGALAVPDETTD